MRRRPIAAVSGMPGRTIDGIDLTHRDGRRAAAREQANVDTTDVAVLEVLDAWADVIETSPTLALSALSEIVASDPQRAKRLTVAAVGEPGVRSRLLHILDELGSSHAADIPMVTPRDRRRALAGVI